MPHGLTMTSYQRENEVVEAAVTFPAVGQGDAVVVLGGEPPLEGSVGGPQARVIPVNSMLKHFYLDTSIPPSMEVCTFHLWLGDGLRLSTLTTSTSSFHNLSIFFESLLCSVHILLLVYNCICIYLNCNFFL